jgi:hypothetical protein
METRIMNQLEKLSVKKYIGIFASLYIFLEIAATIVSQVIKSNQNDWLDFVFLAASAYVTSNSFVRQNGRGFNSDEYKELLVGSILVVAVFFLLLIQFTRISDKLFNYPLVTILITILIFIGLHAAILAFMYSSKIVNHLVKKVSAAQQISSNDSSTINEVEYVAIGSFPPWETELIQSNLKDEGISSFLQKDLSNSISALPTKTFESIKVLVPKEFKEKAVRILARIEDYDNADKSGKE